MMCYYLNVHFQCQRVKHKQIQSLHHLFRRHCANPEGGATRRSSGPYVQRLLRLRTPRFPLKCQGHFKMCFPPPPLRVQLQEKDLMIKVCRCMSTPPLIYDCMQENVALTDSPLGPSLRSVAEMKPTTLTVRRTDAESQGAVALVAHCLARIIRKPIVTVMVGKQEVDTIRPQSCIV